MRDLKGGGKKTVLLAGLSAVGAYVWLPKLWPSGDDSAAAPPPPPSVYADDPVTGGDADPGEPAATAAALNPAAALERIAHDRRLRPAEPGELARDPFTPPAPAPAVADARDEADDPDAPDADAVAGWFPVSATLVGPATAAAVLNGRVAGVGDELEAGGFAFTVTAVRAGAISLRLAGDRRAGTDAAEYTLDLPAPDLPAGVRAAAGPAAPSNHAAGEHGR